jgi:hypothetical protein
MEIRIFFHKKKPIFQRFPHLVRRIYTYIELKIFSWMHLFNCQEMRKIHPNFRWPQN